MMAWWQVALLVLAVAWFVQALGVWIQMRHYQAIFSAARGQWADGRMGTGAAPGRIGKGVIVLMVVDPAGSIRRVCAMQGRSVFAKFRDRAEFNGLPMGEVKERVEAGHIEAGLGQALLKAIEQIEKVDAPKGAVAA
jgi:glucitol operon activator protein